MIDEVRICPVCSREYGESTSACPKDGVALVSLDTGSAERDENRIGQVVAGRYRLERVVGRGGMGTVYACRHVLVGKTFAMKVLRPGVERSSEVLQRFIREAQSANAVQSRHICEMSDFGQLDNGAFYVVMELLDGVSLTRALREGRLDQAELRDVFIQIAETLERAHKAGIVHRDLKPDNVILVNDEESPNFVKLVDFGIAKVLQSEASNLTETGIILGTPYYMSPEQARGESVDARSDIYALGVMMYRAFTGKLPFVADTAMGVLTRHLTETPELPSRIATVDPLVERVILRCMEKRAIDRFQAMSDVAQALRSVTEGSARSGERATVDDRGGAPLRAQLHAQLERDGLGHLLTPTPSRVPHEPPPLASFVAAATPPGLPQPRPPATAAPSWEEPSSRPVPLGAAMAAGVPAPYPYPGPPPTAAAATGSHALPTASSPYPMAAPSATGPSAPSGAFGPVTATTGPHAPYSASGPYGPATAPTGPHAPFPAAGAYGAVTATTGPHAPFSASGAHGPAPSTTGPHAPFAAAGVYGAATTGAHATPWPAHDAGRANASPDLVVEAFTARGVVSSRIDTRSSAGRGRRVTIWATAAAVFAVLAASTATLLLVGRADGPGPSGAGSSEAAGEPPAAGEPRAASTAAPSSEGGSEPTSSAHADATADRAPQGQTKDEAPTASATAASAPTMRPPTPGADAGAPRPTGGFRPPPPTPTSDIRSPFD